MSIEDKFLDENLFVLSEPYLRDNVCLVNVINQAGDVIGRLYKREDSYERNKARWDWYAINRRWPKLITNEAEVLKLANNKLVQSQENDQPKNVIPGSNMQAERLLTKVQALLTSYGSFQLEKDEFFQWPINRFTLTGEIDDNYSDNRKTTITVHFSKESKHDKSILHYNYLSVSVECLINGRLKTYKVTREDLLWSTVATVIEEIFEKLNIKRK